MIWLGLVMLGFIICAGISYFTNSDKDPIEKYGGYVFVGIPLLLFIVFIIYEMCD